ncbi:MAG: hypothetical protein M3506_00425 [Chloroflexota bacterium]|nr:hypothetical protein [Chloroflexota bacterium]
MTEQTLERDYEITRDGSHWVVWAGDASWDTVAYDWQLLGRFTSPSKAEAFVARMQAEGN